LYHVFSLSLRDVKLLLAERGVVVSYETVRRWCKKFGQSFASRLHRRRPRPGDKWHLDEVFIRIQGVQHYLWRAVDQDGVVLDILVQERRDGTAAKRFFRRLLKGPHCVPRVIVTDKLTRRIIRLIQKWLKAGVLEDGVVTVSDKGTGQGSVASPLLANVYLHYVFDLWADRWRRREATGNMIIVRYADDTVVGFEHEIDARRFWDAMRERLQEFALSLHPDKTRLIEFGRQAAVRRAQRGLGKPETFDFLGFTLICGKSRRGNFLLKRRSRRDRMRAKLREVSEGLRWRMHQPIPEQGYWLKQVVTGFFAYHAVPTNSAALESFHHYVTDLWRRSLRRRSQKDRMTWERMAMLANDWLPKPRILHPWPGARFAVRHPRWEPSARIGPARICAGGAQ
jgi:RNA-directed DNA polymerase